MLAAMIIAGLLEGVSIAALLPLLNILVGGTEVEGSFIVQSVNDGLGVVGLEPTVGVLLTMVVLLIITKCAVLVYAAKLIGYTAAVVTMKLRLELLGALMRARWPFFVRQRMGSISASMTSEPNRAATTYVATARTLTGVLQVLVYIILSLAISIEVSFAAVSVGVMSAFILRRFVTIMGTMGQRQTLLTKSLLSGLADGLMSMKPIKAMAREQQLTRILHKDIVAMNKVQQLQVLARVSLSHYVEPITTVALALGLYVILTYWNLPLEELLVMAFLFLRIVGRVTALQSSFQTIARSLPAFWFVHSLLSTAEKAAEKESHRLSPVFESGIHLNDVSFSYIKNKPVLRKVSIEVPKGQFIAIVGDSGCGKTTIVDLVTGLLRPTVGEVLIDGKPLSAIDQKAWRSMIGYVPQDSPLLHDSVLNNVTLRDPNITEAMARKALEQAEAWSFVSALREGLHTIVGERGTRLSGGQRQRIAIARALAHQPKLLILDEATAALDRNTEAEICTTLKRLVGDLTIIAISHQNALKDAANTIHCIENGEVVQIQSGPDRVQLTASF